MGSGQDSKALSFLCDVAGVERIVLGSDNPFVLGDDSPSKIVKTLNLGADAEDKIFFANASKLFRLNTCTCHSNGS